MDSDQAPPAVAAYLTRIGRIRLLTAEQEGVLAELVAAGRRARTRIDGAETLTAETRDGLEDQVAAGREARSAMVNANLRLVVAHAKRFADSTTPLLDIIQEGNVGLIRAVERFDPSLGFKFSTYASWWIRQAIAEALDQQRTIHLPPKAYRQLAECRRARDELNASLGRRPTTAEIAGAAGLDEILVRRLLRSELQPLSLDEPGVGPTARAVADPAEDTAVLVGQAVTSQVVAEAVDLLPPLERTVVRMRYGIGQEVRSRTEVARRLGLGLTAVRRLERTALHRLRRRDRLHRLRAQNTG